MFSRLFSKSQNRYSWQLLRLERKVDLLMEQFNLFYSDPSEEAVRDYLSQGEKLQAVKAFREMNPQKSLQEALEVIELLEQEIQRR